MDDFFPEMISTRSSRRTISAARALSLLNAESTEPDSYNIKENAGYLSTGVENEELCMEDDEELEWEKGSQISSSVVSESYLEDLGLRSPRSPSLHSPSHNLIRMLSNPSLQLTRQRSQSVESFSSSEDDDEFGDDELYDLIDIEPVESESVALVHGILPVETVEATPFTKIPNYVLASIIEYCNEQELLESRLVSKSFKESCDSYLNLLSGLTTKIIGSFKEQYTLSATMLPLYKKQPQINEFLGNLFNFAPWYLMKMVDVAELKRFKESAIFSDKFIEIVLIPELQKRFKLTNPQDPPALFLLSEALLKSKRAELFERALLPVLNKISVDINANSGIVFPQGNFVSQGFLAFSPAIENQKVLGVTLHMAINYNLILTMGHLVKLEPQSIRLKNQFGSTALMKIVECLRPFRVMIPGPNADEDISEWINGFTEKFISGEPIQPAFPGNSRLLIEMFLKIANLISKVFELRADVIYFLGLNEPYTFIRLVGSNLYEKTSTLMHEMISSQQYDLVFSLGFHYGDLIQSQLDINPLHMAAEMNNPLLTAILLRFFDNLKVNQLTTSGSTALGLAVGARGLDSIRILLNDPMTDPNLNKSVSPLIRSIEVCPIEVVESLLSHPSIDIHLQVSRYSKVLSPFSCAVERHNWKVLELLLRSQKTDTANVTVLKHLREAERSLVRAGEKYQELLALVRKAILPSIEE